MEHAEALRDFDIVLICDADSRLHPDALSFINQAFANGCQVIQTTVEREAKASPIGAAVALPEALSQEVDDRARMRFGWSVPLRGTGMAFRRELLMQVGGSLRTRAEDLELSLRLAAAGVRVTKVSRAVVYDPKPLEAMGATRQRARWLQGHWEVVRWYWRDAIQVFRAGYWGDRALLVSLLCRPRTFLIGAKMLLALAGCLWGITSSSRLSMSVGVGASVALLTDFLYYSIGFCFLSRREARGGMWRVVLYAPIWLGAVALSLFSTKKWLRVRDRVVEP
jgi:cellulose synthase/poly-beta-1,6-N-acetylglucosamine synthase-like glycosyltransferase